MIIKVNRIGGYNDVTDDSIYGLSRSCLILFMTDSKYCQLNAFTIYCWPRLKPFRYQKSISKDEGGVGRAVKDCGLLHPSENQQCSNRCLILCPVGPEFEHLNLLRTLLGNNRLKIIKTHTFISSGNYSITLPIQARNEIKPYRD